MLSEGVRITVKKQPEKGTRNRPFVMDGCDLVVMLLPNLYSRLEVIIDGDNVTISDMGKQLSSGTLEVQRSWLDEKLSNGIPVKNIFSGSASIINLVMNFRCYNYDSGQGCKYCGLFAFSMSKTPPKSLAPKYTELLVESAIIAIQNGWRGTMVLTGGALPPSERVNMSEGIERIG